MNGNQDTIPSKDVPGPSIREIVSGLRDWTRLDSVQVLTKWFNVTAKVADAQQSDRGARKG